METITLEQVIRYHVPLPTRANSRGWFSTLCKVCNDHGRKGPRAGFLFESGGGVRYHCFNCGLVTSYDPQEHQDMPKRMIDVLTAYGLSHVDWDPVLYTALVDRSNNGGAGHERRKHVAALVEPKEIPLPAFFDPLVEHGDDVNDYAIEYLSNRCVDWKSQPFYVGRLTEHPDSHKWVGRVIIPVYKDKRLIFYQGRDLSGVRPRKYLSPNVEKNNVLSGYKNIFERTDEPLYITEGWFDSYHLNGVAVFGNIITPEQVAWINQTHRQKVVIPDRFGDGQLLVTQALDLGWNVSYPDIGSCKDVNDAVIKYGLIYTLSTVREQTCSGFEAEARMGIYCENEPSQRKKVHKGASKS